MDLYLTSCSSLRRSFLNLRMVSAGPSMASGGAMTLTRLPSGRRASQIGLDSSTRRPTWLTMRWQMFISCGVVGEAHAGLLHLAGDLDVGGAGAVDHDVGDVVAGQQRLERAVAQHVVADVLEQLLLLGNRHHDVLDLDDLADDVADLLARRGRLQLGELRQVDGVDQRVEDRRLDVVVLFRVPPLRRRPAPARRAAQLALDRRGLGFGGPSARQPPPPAAAAAPRRGALRSSSYACRT